MTDESSGHARYLDRLRTMIGAERYRYRRFTGYPKESPPTAAVPAPEPPRPTGRIVVGVDGSVTSLAALRWAAEDAARRGVPLLAVAAYRRELALLPPFGAVPDAAQIARDMLSRAIREAGALNVETLVVEGPPAARLLQAAREADLLVVGTRRHGAAGALLGPVSRHCVGHATCPVVVVPPAEP